MKSAFKFFALSLLAGTMFAACGGDENETEVPPPPSPIEITNNVNGVIKAGIADAIVITGSGFDESQDYIYIAYDKEDGTNRL